MTDRTATGRKIDATDARTCAIGGKTAGTRGMMVAHATAARMCATDEKTAATVQKTAETVGRIIATGARIAGTGGAHLGNRPPAASRRLAKQGGVLKNATP